MLEFKNLKELLIFNIKYYRYLKNYSQEKLAELCSLSPRYITDIERGRHCPTINKLEDIAKVLEIEPYLLFKNDKKNMIIVNKINSVRQYNQALKNDKNDKNDKNSKNTKKAKISKDEKLTFK